MGGEGGSRLLPLAGYQGGFQLNVELRLVSGVTHTDTEAWNESIAPSAFPPEVPGSFWLIFHCFQDKKTVGSGCGKFDAPNIAESGDTTHTYLELYQHQMALLVFPGEGFVDESVLASQEGFREGLMVVVYFGGDDVFFVARANKCRCRKQDSQLSRT
jgi:hypothetical protein